MWQIEVTNEVSVFNPSRCAAALGVESAFALRAELISLKKVTTRTWFG
jgi:hypothetical protein